MQDIFSSLRRAIAGTPWLVDRDSFERLLDTLPHFAAGESRTRAKPARRSPSGAYLILPVFGVMTYRRTWLTDLFGGTSTAELIQEIKAAGTDTTTDGLVL